MSDGLVLGILFAIAIAIVEVAASGSAARRVETKTVRYRGSNIDDTQRRYSADATLYAGTGWAIHRVAWDTRAPLPTLVATYARYVKEDSWLVVTIRSLLRTRRHVAAILTAIAAPVIMSLLLKDTGVSTGTGTLMLLVAILLGVVIGVRSEHLGRGPHKWLDWSVVFVGAALGLLAVFAFVMLIGLFGSLAGLYLVAASLSAWLMLRAAAAVMRTVASQRERST